MDTYRLRMKVGEHEFDADGPTDFVQAQLATFTALISRVMNIVPPEAPAVAQTTAVVAQAPAINAERTILRQEGRMVSLTKRGRSLQEELLLVLLGQRSLRNNDAVAGNEITNGLRLSGRVVHRVDYELDKMAVAGDVVTMGRGRARRYRLTNQGLAKARALAQSLVANAAQPV